MVCFPKLKLCKILEKTNKYGAFSICFFFVIVSEKMAKKLRKLTFTITKQKLSIKTDFFHLCSYNNYSRFLCFGQFVIVIKSQKIKKNIANLQLRYHYFFLI